MYYLSQVINGIQEYTESEIIHKINGWQKWVIATGISLMLEKSKSFFFKFFLIVSNLSIIFCECKEILRKL